MAQRKHTWRCWLLIRLWKTERGPAEGGFSWEFLKTRKYSRWTSGTTHEIRFLDFLEFCFIDVEFICALVKKGGPERSMVWSTHVGVALLWLESVPCLEMNLTTSKPRGTRGRSLRWRSVPNIPCWRWRIGL